MDSGRVGLGLAHVLAGDEVIDRPIVVGDESIAECFAAGGNNGDLDILGFEGLQQFIDSLIDWDLGNHLVDDLVLVGLAEVGDRGGVDEGKIQIKQNCHISPK